ncbi:MAG: alkyl sulfatase C-terminal domain-containing protein [Jatrophihabitantaceae bacterium]
MASVEECDTAFRALADRIAEADPSRRTDLDRTLTCRLPDIGVIFAGRLHDGTLTDIRRVDDATAQVKLTMSSDDLIALVAGTLKFAGAWANGRVKIDARVFDLIKLRSIF